MTMNNDKTNGFTRRAFNASVAALGAAAATGLAASAKPAGAQSTPKKGGKLRVAWDSTSAKDTLDPAKAVSSTDVGRVTQVYNRLIEVGNDGKLRAALAESWESNKSADEWVFKLRQGVTFDNGKSLTAQDVIYTIRRVLDPATGSGARSQLADVDGNALKADDARTVRIKLTTANVDLPALFTLYQLNIVPDGQANFDVPAGTGPFSVKKWEPGVIGVFARNPNYWKGNGLPYLDEIETIGIPDPTGRFNALIAGDIHALIKLDPGLLKRARDLKEVEIVSTPGPAHSTFPMRLDSPPFDNADVRAALKYAVDRKKLLALAYSDQGALGYDHPVPPFDPFHNADIPLRPYDPDKVKFHLKKAGHENTVFELTTSNAVQSGVDSANVFAEMANQAGAKVKVVQAPADGYWSAIWMKRPFMVSSWQGRATADLILNVMYGSDSKWNETGWKNPRFDQILKEAKTLTDTAKRKQLYAEAQLILYNEGPSVTPLFFNWLDAKSVKLKGIQSHPLGPLGWYFWDTAWLDT